MLFFFPYLIHYYVSWISYGCHASTTLTQFFYLLFFLSYLPLDYSRCLSLPLLFCFMLAQYTYVHNLFFFFLLCTILYIFSMAHIHIYHIYRTTVFIYILNTYIYINNYYRLIRRIIVKTSMNFVFFCFWISHILAVILLINIFSNNYVWTMFNNTSTPLIFSYSYKCFFCFLFILFLCLGNFLFIF